MAKIVTETRAANGDTGAVARAAGFIGSSMVQLTLPPGADNVKITKIWGFKTSTDVVSGAANDPFTMPAWLRLTSQDIRNPNPVSVSTSIELEISDRQKSVNIPIKSDFIFDFYWKNNTIAQAFMTITMFVEIQYEVPGFARR